MREAKKRKRPTGAIVIRLARQRGLGGCTQILLARMGKIGYKGKLLLGNTFNPLNLENAMKNEKINQNLDSNRTLTASNEDELQFLLQAQSVYRETHQVASKADPKTLIDDTELAVILKGNKLLMPRSLKSDWTLF